MTAPDLEPGASVGGGSPALAKPAARYRTIAIGIAGALLLVAALVGTAPFWAPILPWGRALAPIAARNEAPPAARVPPPAAPQPQPRQPPATERSQPPEKAANAALEQLDRRVAALEARPAAAAAGDIADLRQQIAKLSRAAADLATRVETIDTAVRDQASRLSADTALVLALSQIRDAVATGRPFAPAYEAFAALARARPDIATAAAPLAGTAKTGVVGRVALAARLRELARAIATAKPPAPASGTGSTNAAANSASRAAGWTDEALSRLRGLVTIRRIGAAGPSQPGGGPEAAVTAAERALAGGDLDGAVVALGRLSGAPGEAAAPWLSLAKERLAVEAALDRIDFLLVAQLSAPASATPGAGPPR